MWPSWGRREPAILVIGVTYGLFGAERKDPVKLVPGDSFVLSFDIENLQANPQVEVAMKGGARRRMRARVATPEERARLWPLVIADHKNYAGYQTRTQREIPLVLLEPE